MNILLRCAPTLALALVCGCRAHVGQELLERELLAQENQIYQLQDLVDEFESRLDSCQRENEALLGELGRARVSGKRSTAPAARAVEELRPPVVESGADEAVLPYDGPPIISPPDPKVPEGERLPKGPGGPNIGPPGGVQARSASTKRGPIDQVVMRISLNRKLTGGHNVDDRVGHEGVMVVVEPLNAAGDLVEVPGDVSIVVLDPAVEGEAARIARWDFNSKEAAEHLKRTPLGDGLHFDLRWPHSPPVHRVLNLYVRYTTADGRRLQVEKQIEIDPPGEEKPADRLTETPPLDPALAEAEDSDRQVGSPRAQATTIRSESDAAKQDGAGKEARRDGVNASAAKSGVRWTPNR